MPKLSDLAAQRIRKILDSNETNFVALIRTAGLRPDRDFRHLVLREIDFSGSDLGDFDFTGARFERCSFAGAWLGSAILEDAVFSGCDLAGAAEWSAELVAAKATSRHDQALPAIEDEGEDPLEEALRRLEEELGNSDWPMLFRGTWYVHRPEPKLVEAARRWLKRGDTGDPGGVVTVILPLLDEKRLQPDVARWVGDFAIDWLHRHGAVESRWTKLWSRLLIEPARRPGLLELGAARLDELTGKLHHSRQSPKLEIAWTALWRQLSMNGADPQWLELMARNGAPYMESPGFVTGVLLRQWQVGRTRWAEQALHHWIDRNDPRRRGWTTVLVALLDSEAAPNLLPRAYDWLHRDFEAAEWPAVWRAAMRIRPVFTNEGMAWLQSKLLSHKQAAEVLLTLARSVEAERLAELKSMALAWLEQGLQHPRRDAIAAFAGSDPMLGLQLRGRGEQRAKILWALGRATGAPLVEVARNKFCSSDGTSRFVVRLSKPYPRPGGARYWYGYYEAVDSFLESDDSLLIIGCLDRDDAFAIPAGFLRELLPDLHRTIRPPASSYWHLDLLESGGTFALALPKRVDTVSVDRFRFNVG